VTREAIRAAPSVLVSVFMLKRSSLKRRMSCSTERVGGASTLRRCQERAQATINVLISIVLAQRSLGDKRARTSEARALGFPFGPRK
jgi:hypothetical protein